MRRRIENYNTRHPDHPRDMPTGGPERQPSMLPIKHDLVISWTGMRGVVTLAAAAGIPATAMGGQAFPARPEIQLIAFVVAVGTLLLQGLTLPPFIRRLDIHADEDEAYEANQRQHAAEIIQRATADVITKAMTDLKINFEKNGSDKINNAGLDPAALTALSEQLQRFQRNREALQQEAEDSERTDLDQRRTARWQLMSKIRIEMLTAQRRALTAERDAFRLDDDTYREMLEQLDYDEAAISTRMAARL